MRRWVGLVSNRLRNSKNSIAKRHSFFSTNSDKPIVSEGSVSHYNESVSKLDKLDFMTAAKILFTNPTPKNNKFGFDFHLVQFFFACMPSLAVYLVAQYSRYEMRRMEAELEKKRKTEEEAKAKEEELKASEENEKNPIPDLSEVNVRLDKLEEAVKEIAVESKKQLDKTSAKIANNASEKKIDNAMSDGKTEAKSKTNNSEPKDQNSKEKSSEKEPSSGRVDASS